MKRRQPCAIYDQGGQDIMAISKLVSFALFLLPLLQHVECLNDRIPALWASKPLAFVTKKSSQQQQQGQGSSETIEVHMDELSRIGFQSMPPEIKSYSSTHQIRNSRQVEDRTAEAAEDHPPRIIIIGGPASGKGTQCEHIAKAYGVVHLSTGDMLRNAIKEGRPFGLLAKEYMDRGELVPDEIIIQIVADRLKGEDCQTSGWLLDGFPRTRAQAEFLSGMGIEADVTLLLDVSDEELLERIVGRRMDPETGKIYHMTFRPPPPEIVDRLEQRSDDTVEKTKLRLQQFHENVSQIRSYLQGSIVEIDGTGNPSHVAERVANVLTAKVKSKVLSY